jgi:hypothetical protein
MKLSQDEAIRRIQSLISEIEGLKHGRAFSDTHTRWLSNTLALARAVFGGGSPLFLSLGRLPWRRTGSFVVSPLHQGVSDYNVAAEMIHHEAYLEQLGTAKGLLESGIDQIKAQGLDAVYEAGSAQQSTEMLKLVDLAEHKLRKTLRQVPDREKEVQDKFEDLLVGRGDIDYLREQERISYSSKAYQPDFTFPTIHAALEVKLCDKPGRDKQIISEINDDIQAYKTKYPNLLFVVYDTRVIRDVDKFRDDIEAADGVFVIVVKH